MSGLRSARGACTVECSTACMIAESASSGRLGVVVVERVAVDMRLAYDFGDGDLAVFVVCEQLQNAFSRRSVAESIVGILAWARHDGSLPA